YNFLILGLDHSGYLADVMLIAHLDTENHSVSVMQLPRDLYFEAESGKNKINAAFSSLRKAMENEGSEKPVLDAASRLAEEIGRAMALDLPYQLVFRLETFVEVFDLLLPEGMAFEIPFDMDYDDPEQDLSIHFKKGPTVLHGQHALEFVRYRSGYVLADVGRMDAQKLFLSSLFSSLLNAFRESGIAEMANVAGKAMAKLETNVSFLDGVYFARQLSKTNLSELRFLTLPGEAVRSEDNTWFYQANREDLRVAVNLYLNRYEEEIPDISFDPEYVLVKEDDRILLRLYLDETGTYLKVYTAREIVDESIEIKTK
ncbi:MAG: LCP family protein, partial [Clostridia bacterium]|nr:LCP family protein [Clostridia bacterium]